MSSKNNLTPLELAIAEIRRGMAPIPVPLNAKNKPGKNPDRTGWEDLRITEATAPQYFNGASMNIGALNGEPSGNYVDIDLDCRLACEAAKQILPPTHSRYGRKSNPESHYGYRLEDPEKASHVAATQQWHDPLTNDVILEFRWTGSQSIRPGSLHVESQEYYEWAEDGEPARVRMADLMASCDWIAAVAVLVPHWAEGKHNTLNTCLVGTLLRAGWETSAVKNFVRAIATVAGDDKVSERLKVVDRFARDLKGERRRVPGLPKLKEVIGPTGPAVVAALTEWLDLGPNTDDIVEQVNAEHALVFVGDKIGVLWPNKYNRGEGMPRITKISDLRIEWADRMVGDLNPVTIWLESPNRRKYEEMVFRPGVTDTGNDFNFWRGWPVAPVKGDCHLFLAHLREIICGGDEVAYRYFLDWLANIFQEPENKPGTAIGLGSIEGTGKGALIEYIRPLLEPHFWHMSGSSLIDGQFNDFLAGRLLVYGDESLWAGKKSTIAKIKGYITEHRIAVERKCVPAFQIDMLARFIFASNEEHFAPAGRNDRRFVPFKPRAMRRDDIPYFEALDREAKNGGRQALMWLLLNEVDGSTNHLRVVPKTRAHTEQKLLGLDDVGQFWRLMLFDNYHEILRGYGDNTEVEHAFTFGKAVQTTTLFAFYLKYVRDSRINYVQSIDGFGKALRHYLELTRRDPRKDEMAQLGIDSMNRCKVNELPTLAEARQQFREAVGEHVEWSTPDGDENEEPEIDLEEIMPIVSYAGDWDAYLRSMDVDPDDWKRRNRHLLEPTVGATTF